MSNYDKLLVVVAYMKKGTNGRLALDNALRILGQ
jgi:hypothetical protein